MGVDGVLQTTVDELVCYQSKFRAGRPALTWTELSTFFGLADAEVERLVFTNCDDIASVAEERKRAVFVRGSDLDRLTADDFRVIESWLAGSVAPKKKKTPLPHQDAAIRDILTGLERRPRATALMACGSGKTLVALWVAERLNARTILVLLPSLALVRQTLHEWFHETNWQDIEYRCVCSDPTVQLEEDALVVRPSELDFPVTTESADLRRFLERQTSAVRIVFSTYHSCNVVAEAVAGLPPFDIAVFDEAHKTAGREGMKFALALNDSRLPIACRLFLTATPRHYDVAPKDKLGDERIVLSMDVPEIYGPVVHRLPFSTAAKLGIITDYKVLISIVTSDMVTDELLRRGVVLVEGEEIKARQVANQIALKSAIDQHGVSKVFTFHSKVESAKSFTSDGPEGIATHLSEFHCAHINGAMSTAYRKRLMDEFAAAERAILSNARCLTEGVDVPAVDMVAFLSPRRSLVDIVQATGRAMRLSPGKEFGYVLVPLYVEKARGETIEEAVKRSDFDEVWNVLRQLQEHDDLLAQIISEMRIERGRTGGFDDSRFRERVQVLGPSLSLETLRSSITAACLDAIGEAWFERYGQLVAYQKKHGNCDIPARWSENKKLATWVVNQRVYQRDGVLDDEKVELLNRIGFKWNPKVSLWRTHYLALLEYRNRFGNCRVPQDWKENPKLAKWVSTQRIQHGRNKLSRERIAMLEKIGFEWSVGVTWDERFAELCAFKERFGHTRVKVKWEENPLLGQWAVDQRYRRRRGELRKDFEDRLNSIGFEWELPRHRLPVADSRPRLAELRAFKAEHGHLSVSRHDKKYPGLASWMTHQRMHLKSGTMREELKRELDEIGFPWMSSGHDEKWAEMFARFKEYAALHGAGSVTVVDEATRKLNRWIIWQRQERRRGSLSDARIQALDGIGFVWEHVRKPATTKPTRSTMSIEIPRRSWDELFSDLTEFFKVHGHCNVPLDWQANPELARWVYLQRIAKRQGRLSTEQVRRMENLGFAWTTHDGEWEAMFTKLVEHMRPMHNGKPRDVPPSAELRRWMLTQRQLKKRGELDGERARKLTSIGFEWQPYSKQWQEMFDALRMFREAHGHCRVPAQWDENPKLARWVATQRARKAAGLLSADRISALDALGFSWRIGASGRTQSVEAWDKMFAALKSFHAEHGHANVPQQFVSNRKLGWWVTTQRRNFRQGKLATQQIARLNELGFDWPPLGGKSYDARWDAMLSELKAFHERHGHCRVPMRWPENPQLANWVGVQRRQRKHRHLSQDRIAALDAIGFVWRVERPGEQGFVGTRKEIEVQSWNAMFEELKKYIEAHGNCLVPQRSREHPRLADWVSSQRVAHNKGLLDSARDQKLTALGFNWNPIGNRWDEMFAQLVEFKKQHGHTNVPQRVSKYTQLANWVRNQRAAKRYGDPIIAIRGPRLDEIGFAWRLVETNPWESMFNKLVEFKKLHGHCNVPQKGGGDKRLGKWVNTQRTHNTRGTLLPERKQKLDSIGFVWNLRPNLAPARQATTK